MIRACIAALALSLAASTASAQACLSYSDGLGNTTVTCPDGRQGYIRTDPAGVASGMIGTEPFQGPASSLAPPLGPPPGVPSSAYIYLPPPPPPPVAPAYEPPPLAAVGPPPPQLTPLQRQYLEEQARKSFEKRKLDAARQRAEKAETKKPSAPVSR